MKSRFVSRLNELLKMTDDDEYADNRRDVLQWLIDMTVTLGDWLPENYWPHYAYFSADGGISLEWEWGKYEIDLEITKRSKGYLSLYDNKRKDIIFMYAFNDEEA